VGKAWEAERVIGEEQVRALLAGQFPELPCSRLRLLGNGWDNSAYLVDEEWLFRFPRRQIAVALLKAETLLLPRIADRLPLPVPRPVYVGHPTEDYPWPFTGYRMLPGCTACGAGLSEAERIDMAEPLGRFLAALHALPLEEGERANLPTDPLLKLNAKNLKERIEQNLAEALVLRLIESVKPWQPILDSIPQLPLPVSSVIVHGDLYMRHLLVDREHRLAGIIDWGDVQIGDPALDLSIVHSFLPPSAHGIFRRAYGEISSATWQLARLRALHSCALVTVYCHHIGDATLLREALLGLRQLGEI